MSMPASSDPETRAPAPLTELVGREREVREVADLILDPSTRLVTVTGPGGVGKTRLALAIANDLANAFRDGVWFVQLGPIDDASLVAPAIAQALRIRDTGGDPLLPRVQERLQESECLLILDNFEQVRDAALAVFELVSTCPGITVLVTSRVVLNLSGEQVYTVPPLRLPTVEAGEGIAALARAEAIQLFVARAGAGNPAFQLTERNAPVVAEICRRLDGLPLAIELAAARTRLLSPEALLARLTQRLSLLTGGAGDLPPRHRTMRAAVDWSANLLSPAEREVFRRLSVFHDDASIDAVAAVAGYTLAGGPEAALDVLSSLVDQSLVQPMRSDSGEPRFGLLETLREFGREDLAASAETDEAHRRHAAWFLQFAEEASPHLTGSRQAWWLDELDRVHDDLRAAFRWFDEHDDPEGMLRLAAALWRFGYTRGHLRETRHRLQASLLKYHEPNAWRVEALNGEGLLASMQGDTETAETRHAEAMAISRARGDGRGVAVALNGLGDAAAVAGRRSLAHERYEAALAVFRDMDDRRGIAGVLTNLGNLYWDELDLGQTQACHEEALAVFRDIDERRGIAWGTSNLGTLMAQLGEAELALEYLREAMDLYRELSDPLGIVTTLEGCSEVAGQLGHREREVVLLAAAHAIREAVGAPVPAGDRQRYDDLLARLRNQLGARFESAWAAGLAISLDDAVSTAIETGAAAPAAFTRGTSRVPGESYGLTNREWEVLRLIAAGSTNAEISGVLDISVRTVSTHVSNILSKLGLSTRSAVAAFAHREGVA